MEGWCLVKVGDTVRVKGIAADHAEYDVGVIESIDDDGTAQVKWSRANETYLEVLDALEHLPGVLS